MQRLERPRQVWLLLIPDSGLRMLGVPIAQKVVPKETIYASKDGIELIVLVRLVDFVASFTKTEKNRLDPDA